MPISFTQNRYITVITGWVDSSDENFEHIVHVISDYYRTVSTFGIRTRDYSAPCCMFISIGY